MNSLRLLLALACLIGPRAAVHAQRPELLDRLEKEAHGVDFLTFSRDGKTLASDGGQIQFWNVATGQRKRKVEGPTNSFTAVSLSGDGKTLAFGTYGHTIELWDVARGNLQKTLHGHTHVLNSLS